MAAHNLVTEQGDRALWVLAGLGALFAVAQGAVGLAMAPSPGAEFHKTIADYVTTTLSGLAFGFTLAGLWGIARGAHARVVEIAAYAALVGQAGLVLAEFATVLAGRPMLDAVFIVGFGLLVLALLVIAIGARRLLVGALVPALMLGLAFGSKGGLVAFGGVWVALAVRRGR